jgi:hypothetical protein
MAFVRCKKINGRHYFYLVENLRREGKVKQEIIAYMSTCPTIEEALDHWRTIAKGRRARWTYGSYVAGYSEVERVRAKEYAKTLEAYLAGDLDDLEEDKRAAKAAASPAHPRTKKPQRKRRDDVAYLVKSVLGS